jgi:hypothetical protein
MATKPAPATPAGFAVILTPDKAGGRRAVGDMVPGREYTVPAAEALRLVDLKGFDFVNPADAAAAKAALATTTPSEG